MTISRIAETGRHEHGIKHLFGSQEVFCRPRPLVTRRSRWGAWAQGGADHWESPAFPSLAEAITALVPPQGWPQAAASPDPGGAGDGRGQGGNNRHGQQARATEAERAEHASTQGRAGGTPEEAGRKARARPTGRSPQGPKPEGRREGGPGDGGRPKGQGREGARATNGSPKRNEAGPRAPTRARAPRGRKAAGRGRAKSRGAPGGPASGRARPRRGRTRVGKKRAGRRRTRRPGPKPRTPQNGKEWRSHDEAKMAEDCRPVWAADKARVYKLSSHGVSLWR